ncbi:hypothetical protein CDAR_25111 [Caerostris darwini]|uniref:Uncharacterized protein n=1 Tax=Caerostris darwini TaxID=1538125 RepID=A0AAV4N2E6_9ARAC|nr:hypothetical protein CDAR_25111 [Caerostris darwini]
MAGSNKKINYKHKLENFIKSPFPDLKIENTGIENASKLLNVVQRKLIEAVDKEIKAINKIDEYTFHKCEKNIVENTYWGNLKYHVMSEALLQSGCMTHGDEPSIYKKSENCEKVMSKRSVLMLNKFSAEVTCRLVSVSQPNINFEEMVQTLPGRRLHNFAKIDA